MNPLDAVYKDLQQCRKCLTLPELQDMTPKDFAYHWIPFRFGDAPYAYLFLGWEPSFKSVERGAEYPQIGTFNDPLQFFIKHLLVAGGSKSYLMTNMAKCSMHIGKTCDQTRDHRFKTCAWSLRRELESTAPDATIISIGKAPEIFLAKHKETHKEWYGRSLTGGAIQAITHYSPRNNRIFKRFADEKLDAYEKFRTTYRKVYGRFLHKENPKEYSEDAEPCESDLQRLFKWSDEMLTMRRDNS